MTKFIVIYTEERNSELKGVFETLDDAQKCMEDNLEKYFKEELNVSREEVEDEIDNEWGIEEKLAWSNLYGRNLDINIFEI